MDILFVLVAIVLANTLGLINVYMQLCNMTEYVDWLGDRVTRFNSAVVSDIDVIHDKLESANNRINGVLWRAKRHEKSKTK